MSKITNDGLTSGLVQNALGLQLHHMTTVRVKGLEQDVRTQ